MDAVCRGEEGRLKEAIPSRSENQRRDKAAECK
jgi:hypothetical protein